MRKKGSIIVIDDEEVICESCRRILEEAGFEVETVTNSRKALDRIREKLFDVAIVDLKMPEIDGMEILRRIKKHSPEVMVIIITGYSTVDSAVKAMKMGAFDYVPKPFTPDELEMIVKNALEKKRLIFENRYLRSQLKEKYSFYNIIGKSPKMQEVYQTLEKVAPTDSTVLIYGESGTGKELVAKAIHYNSPRRDKPFISVDCGALSESLLESELFGHVKGSFTDAVVTKPGLFEVANGGTFFLDEVGNISLSIQAKLLRVLQEREFKPVGGTKWKKVDIRLIAATNQDLEKLIREGKFREDLFYRLNIVPIFLPPLRERKEDIPLLAFHFLQKFNQERNKNVKGISPEAMEILINYSWPGNVRELENVIERLIVMSEEEVIKPHHLPLSIRGKEPTIEVETPRSWEEMKKLKKELKRKVTEKIERKFLIETLRRNNWNITRSAKDVGMQRQNFQALLKKYNITPQKSE
ncbi:sigma-54-dependent Fis family transcriptional regulator [Candidatus Aerophobetes bacterium]|nr:sigma-54-dependent Fis family transcriptional regulator [Candidatus Aerophobetes bacterium]